MILCIKSPFFPFPLDFSTDFKMKKFNFRKVLDGLTASSPGSGSSSGINSSGGAGSGSLHPGGTAGALREEIQETLTSDYFQICKVSLELAEGLLLVYLTLVRI